MRKRRQYQLESLAPLEPRIVLSASLRGGATIVRPHAAGRENVPIRQNANDMINQAFDSFTTDYLQAQSVYIVSKSPPAALQTFTTQRVNLLAQELVRAMSGLPGTLKKLSPSARQRFGNSDVNLQVFLQRRIDGGRGTQSLLRTLNSNNVVPPSGTSGAGATLYTLTATNAIESARTATLNAAHFSVTGRFAKHS